MNKVGLQVYTIRDVFEKEGYEAAFKKIAEAGYTQAQTASTYTDLDDAKAYAKAAQDAGVEIVGTHYSWEKIRDNVEETVEIHKILGTTNVGIGGMPAEARKDYDELVKFIADFNAAAEKYKAYGMKLTYHNHSFEFVKIKDGKFYKFVWEDTFQEVEQTINRPISQVRYNWLAEDRVDTYFEFKIHTMELSNEIALEVIAFATPDEKDDAIFLWETQIGLLKRKLGI